MLYTSRQCRQTTTTALRDQDGWRAHIKSNANVDVVWQQLTHQKLLATLDTREDFKVRGRAVSLVDDVRHGRGLDDLPTR